MQGNLMVKESFQQMVLEQFIWGEKMNLDPYPMLYIKIKLKWAIDSCKS